MLVTNTKRIYLAGPMRNKPKFNFPAFHAAAKKLREAGHFVFNPAEKDIERDGKDWGIEVPSGDLAQTTLKGFDLRKALCDDMDFICMVANVIAMLPGWEDSKGAMAERATAIALGLEIWYLEENYYLDKNNDIPEDLGVEVYNTKPTNPKDAVGIAKAPTSTISQPVIYEVGLAMMEGAMKYGRHNYRVIGVRASVYYDAFKRHVDAWWEGEDIDPDTKEAELHHVTKAIASLVVLRDAMIQGKFTDDRPPRTEGSWMTELNKKAKTLLKMYPNPKAAYTQEG